MNSVLLPVVIVQENLMKILQIRMKATKLAYFHPDLQFSHENLLEFPGLLRLLVKRFPTAYRLKKVGLEQSPAFRFDFLKKV